MISNPSLLDLFLNFLRLGMTAFGGPSMVAYIRKLAVEQKKWLESSEFGEGAALCQMIPGATAMQMAAYVGLRAQGIPGAAVCFAGFGLPAFLLMLIFAALYAETGSLPAVVSAFSGLQAVVIAIICNAALLFGKTTLKNWKNFLIAGIALLAFWLDFHPLFVILFASALGVLLLPAPGKSIDRGSPPVLPHFYKRTIMAILAAAAAILAGVFVYSKELFDLAILMMRIDLMAFGGGFAAVPIMYHEVVEVNNWLSGLTFMNGIILGQVTPGPVVITATFIGYMLMGVPGAVVASLFIFLPSFLMVVTLSPLFTWLRCSDIFAKIIHGVLCSFVGLLISVAIKFGLQVEWDVIHAALALGAMVALLRKIDILWVVIAGTILSIVFIH